MGALDNIQRKGKEFKKLSDDLHLEKLPPMGKAAFDAGAKRLKPLVANIGVYWWVYGWHKNRRIILGPYSSEEEAYEDGYAKISSDVKAVPLRTRDEQKASREIRARVLDETRDIDETFRRFRHKVDGGE